MNIKKLILSGACLLSTLSLLPAAQKIALPRLSNLRIKYQQKVKQRPITAKLEREICEILEELAQSANYLDVNRMDAFGGLTLAQWVEGAYIEFRDALGREPNCVLPGFIPPQQPQRMPQQPQPRRRPTPARPVRPTAPSEELTPEEIEFISRDVQRGVRPPVRRPTPPRPRPSAPPAGPALDIEEEVARIESMYPPQPRPSAPPGGPEFGEEEPTRKRERGERPGARRPEEPTPRPREPERKFDQEIQELEDVLPGPQPTPRPQPQPSPRKPEPRIPYCPAPGFKPEEERKKEAPATIRVPQAVLPYELPPVPIAQPAPQVVDAPVRPARAEQLPHRAAIELPKIEDRPQQRHEFAPRRPVRRQPLGTIGAPQPAGPVRIVMEESEPERQEFQPIVVPKPGPTEIGPKEQAELARLEAEARAAERERKLQEGAKPVPQVQPAQPTTLPSPVSRVRIEEQELPPMVQDIATPRMRKKLTIPAVPKSAVEEKEEAEESEEGSVAGATPPASLPSAFGTEPAKSAMRQPRAQPAGKKVSFAELLQAEEAVAERERKSEAIERARAKYKTIEQYQKERREQRAQAIQAFPKIKDASQAFNELRWLADQSDQIEKWAQEQQLSAETVNELWNENIVLAEGYAKRIGQLVGRVGGAMDLTVRAHKLVEKISLNVAEYKAKQARMGRR